MKRLSALLALLIAATAAFTHETRAADVRIETPSLAAAVAAGELPPVGERLPSDPAVAPGEPGRPGGDMRMLMAGAKDTRMMVVFGYSRLIGYTPELQLVPNLAKSVDVEDGDRVFTFHLRAGHKWSDGSPFTSEDFRFWFEDVAQNKMISPSGLPPELLPEGEKPQVEFPDALTVRYRWSHPNPLFLPALAMPNPTYIYMPAAYLKQFHQRYADKAALAARVKDAKQRNWAALFNKVSNAYRNDNPDLPSLEPWVLKTRPPADRFIFERNPYFHWVDTAGHQLPYIDRVLMTIADNKIIPAKTGSGESDLQARYLRFDNYTFLKDAEERNGYTVRLWKTAPGSQLALYPNLNVNDPAWRALFRDIRFRHALSLAIDRHEINQAIYYGLAKEGQNTVLPGSPLYRPEYRKAWATYDPDAANRLLDQLGLVKRDSEGIRLLPDGRPLQIIVENAGEATEESDVLELIRDSWREVGIKLFSKPSQPQVFRERVFSGEAMMSISKGLENGLVTAAMPPLELTPTSQQQLQWPKWGQYYENKGAAGEAPDMPFAKDLLRLLQAWFNSGSMEERGKIWQDILSIHAEQVTSLGIVAGVPQPVVVSDKLRNVPEEGIYNFDPGAYFGIYHPDRFWLDEPAQAATAEH
jgi:peptide/nickel transport system substrate-binding protein